MNDLGVALWILYFTLTLAAPVAIRWRRTGSTGLRLGSARPGSLQWWADAVEIVALGCGVSAAVAARSLEPLAILENRTADAAGTLVFSCATALIVVSQMTMGASWRIGVDPTERTELVTHGVFGIVRNPIFSGLVLLQFGVFLLVPNVLAAAGLSLMVLSVELQVRGVEEPHLLALHGEEHSRYAARVGRFVPVIGRAGEP